MKKTNLHQLELNHREQGNFGFTRGSLTQGTAAQQLGCSYYELAPGKKSFPFHFHHAAEEAILVLEGEGTLRLGEERLTLVQGDYVPLPAGKAFAHQLANQSDQVFKYLAFSTFTPNEIVEYPDSNKVGVFAGMVPGLPPSAGSLWQVHKKEGACGYYDGEE